MTTDNLIIRRKTLNSPAIMCSQRSGTKIIATEKDFIQANKIGFNDEIGKITNRATSMIDVQAGFPKGSKEWEILDYRIKCGQLLQQESIDRIKGIEAKPMPEHWYNRHACAIQDDDDEQTIQEKNLNLSVIADRKPYFMIYVYPDLRKEYKKYVDGANAKSLRTFGIPLNELLSLEEKTEQQKEFIDYYWKFIPVGYHDCTINKICWLFEKNFDEYLSRTLPKVDFDYSILKCGIDYTNYTYKKVYKVYEEYKKQITKFHSDARNKRIDKETCVENKDILAQRFAVECFKICNDEKVICDIVLDICYQTENSKQFAWDVCGDTIIENLLVKNENMIQYVEQVDCNGEFSLSGVQYAMKQEKYTLEDNE